MSRYTIQVELKEQTEKSRVELHITMLENGFTHNIVCDKGFTYALPGNDFVYAGSENIGMLMDRILHLLSSLSKDPAILVTRSEERCWSGLRVVDPEQDELP